MWSSRVQNLQQLPNLVAAREFEEDLLQACVTRAGFAAKVFDGPLGPDAALSELAYQSIPEWDSVGHMGLIANLEEAFDIMMDMEDIIDFASYEVGKDLLKKYQVEL